jgi:hypothetical protein
MPLSGSVTAGSAALASQYNNLRDDVLNVSTGHTHTGASEDGKKVHGTALDTTGATNGQVLTANGSGGATFAAAAGAGQLSTLTGSAAFSTAASGVFTALQVSDTTSIPRVAVTGGGTVIIALCDTGEDTGTHAFQAYYLGSTVIQGSSAVAPVTAGTIYYDYPLGYGFSSGTAFVIREATKTTAPANVFYLRKFNQTLGSNMWNATLLASFSSTIDFGSYGPFSSYQIGRDNGKYESSIGVWIGGDYRRGDMGTAQATASVYVVNDASGSVYSAPFGACGGTTSASIADTSSVCYVPGIGTALGTVHAFGNVDGNARWVKYTVGSASITAVSTATNNDAMIAGAVPADRISASFWHPSATAIALYDSGGDSFVFVDRTAGTVLSITPKEVESTTPRASNGNDGIFDYKTGWGGGPADSISQYRGVYGNATMWCMGTAFRAVNGNMYRAGAGSATTFVYAASAGRLTTTPIVGVAQVAIGSASTGRMITFPSVNHPINISASSGYWIGEPYQNAAVSNNVEGQVGLIYNPRLPTLVLPAGASAVVTYRTRAYDASKAAASSDNPAAIGTSVYQTAGTALWLTSGGTASLFANVISLA